MLSKFKTLLNECSRGLSQENRKWFYLPYDQVTDRIGPLSQLPPQECGIILVESPWKAARRPYHKQKLALILSNLRHFALEQARRGVAVKHIVVNGPYSQALGQAASEVGTITMMEAAELELRKDLQGLVESGALQVVPHQGWLASVEDLLACEKNGKFRMDAFYRRLRQKTNILMEAGKPQGGKYSFDSENRQPWKGEPQPPAVPVFSPDEITEEVGALIESRFSRHPGQLSLEHLPASQADADHLWQWARENCLPHFGPYEDAMSSRSSGLFHTRISPLLNIHRILPGQVVEDVLNMDLPLASKEGFIRQVLGWREFVRAVHVHTDGFRKGRVQAEIRSSPSDAGYGAWSGHSFDGSQQENHFSGDGGAAPNYLESHEDLPPAFWGQPCGLNCLDHVVQDVLKEGYSHHITRLMILCNLGTLLDIEPRQLSDWFWVAYADAYDWVVEPNVLAMGTFSLADMITTKPYVSGAAYINKMSDYCRSCRFDPKSCPVTRLYWAFLERKWEKLKDNQRLSMPINSLKKRSPQDKEKDRAVFQKLTALLKAGQVAIPEQFTQ